MKIGSLGSQPCYKFLVSIQALILNAKPWFNEPGREQGANAPQGERHSKQHNEEVFVLSLKTMVYTVRGPPKHFEDFVLHHFRRRARDILVACNAYLEGALVGSEINKDGGVVNQAESKCSSSKSKFMSDAAGLMKVLVRYFVENGSPETELESF